MRRYAFWHTHVAYMQCHTDYAAVCIVQCTHTRTHTHTHTHTHTYHSCYCVFNIRNGYSWFMNFQQRSLIAGLCGLGQLSLSLILRIQKIKDFCSNLWWSSIDLEFWKLLLEFGLLAGIMIGSDMLLFFLEGCSTRASKIVPARNWRAPHHTTPTSS